MARASNSDRGVFELTNAGLTLGRTPVLQALNLSIADGERVAVIGPSGAGKTTLFRLMSAAVRPDEGTVVALGADTRRLRGKELRRLRREIGVVHQVDNLIPQLRVVHNVLMGRLGHWGVWRALLSLFLPREQETARAALAEVELEHRLWAMPDELSGGEQQRVAIARLVVQRPSVILADEPVSQLDIRLGRGVIALLMATADRNSATLVVNLHTLDLLQSGFTRIVALRDGELFWSGRPDEISREMLQELYGAEYKALHLEELPIGAP